MNSKTETPTGHLTLDDLTVGQIFHSGTYQLNKEEIIAFAGQFDPQPYHTDEKAAADSFFKGLAASGWHTAAITMRLIVLTTPILGGLVGASADLSWPRAVRPGDTLHVVSEVTKIEPSRSRPDRGIATIRSITKNQNEETVQILTSRLVVPRRVSSG